eukprot:TRINITY_DN12137_c0_g1_i1.p1 TRINITY_DN12137_c0_g1~~TRINITY_DN12137_c0_g1_i1.p1  ORF type:complete len:282 (+),score=46.76 TRINITY_DN12137_c0_g1_i1:345-1190(+)
MEEESISEEIASRQLYQNIANYKNTLKLINNNIINQTIEFHKEQEYSFEIKNNQLNFLNNGSISTIQEFNKTISCSFSFYWLSDDQIMLKNLFNSQQCRVAMGLNTVQQLKDQNVYIFDYTKNEMTEQIVKIKVKKIREEIGHCELEAYNSHSTTPFTSHQCNFVDKEEIYLGNTPLQQFTLNIPYKDRKLGNARIFAHEFETNQQFQTELLIQEFYDDNNSFSKNCTLWSELNAGAIMLIRVTQCKEKVELFLKFGEQLYFQLQILDGDKLNVKLLESNS